MALPFLAVLSLLAAEEAVLLGPNRMYCNDSDYCQWKDLDDRADNRIPIFAGLNSLQLNTTKFPAIPRDFFFNETGRVSTKMDVYSFGVVLMELITGRKALDKSLPKEKQHLVAWFRSMLISKGTDAFPNAIDPNLDITEEETLSSIITVAELADYCSSREPNQRPPMSHVVHVLSSLAGVWKPTERADPLDREGIKRRMTLTQMIKKWKVAEGMSSLQ